MKKILLAASILAALSSATAVEAANAVAQPFTPAHRFSSQDLAAFADARIAALKAGLQLKPEQDKNWPAMEAALRDVAKARIARAEEWRDKGPTTFETDPIAALQRRAQSMTARAAELDKLAAAARPLYDSLDDAQKRRFGALLKVAIAGRMHGMRGAMRHGDPGAGIE